MATTPGNEGTPSTFGVHDRTTRASVRLQLREFLRRLAQLIALVTALLIAGTVGYAITEDRSIWSSLIWTLDTVATIGSVDPPETVAGEIVKILLITLGVGTFFYALVTVTEVFVAGHLGELLADRRSLKKISSLQDHYLICGFGRVGRQVARDLRAAGQPFVVVDELDENRERAAAQGIPFIEGKPSDDEILRAAGIDKARSVLACVDSDAENIFICLTARELRSDISIVARAAVEDSEAKLRRAGANRVISPYKSSGSEMARLALNPQVSGVVDVAPEYRLEEITVTPGCIGQGKAIADVSGSALIVALRKADGTIQPQPPADTVLQDDDVIVAMGTPNALGRLEDTFTPGFTHGDKRG